MHDRERPGTWRFLKFVGRLWLILAAFIVGTGYEIIWRESGFGVVEVIIIFVAFSPGVFLLWWAAYRERAERRRL